VTTTSNPAPRDTIDPAALLAAGALAPSSHNTQPWELTWRDGAVEVHGALERALPVADPAHRELRLACGAAMTNVQVAMRAQGRRPHVRLLPDPDEPWYLGRVAVGASLPPTSLESAMAHAVSRRRTDRAPLSGQGVSPRVRDELRRAGRLEHTWVIFVEDPTERRALRNLTAAAHAAQQADAAFRAEWARWVGEGDRHGAGLPEDILDRAARPDGVWRRRDFGAPADPDDRRPPAGADDPALLVVATTLDQPLAHLHAGQALQHVLLLATVRGLAASFVAPPVEVPEPRADLRALLGGALWPQAVLRLGVRSRPVRQPPRRA
jgi:nitroreductase